MDPEANDKDWTRNIQQKFDVVRQEVDEFVSMDTLRYVENQVQTLGETVKGFYSNFLQDFLPPALSIPVYHDAGTVPQEGKFVTETYKKSVTNIKEKYVDANTKLLPSALSNPVNHDAEAVPPKGKFVTETYKKSVTNLKEKYVDTNSKLLPSALSSPVNHDADQLVPQKGNFVMETCKKSATNLKEKYVDTNIKLLPSALSDLVNHDAESFSQRGNFVTETYKKSATDLKEKYVDTNTKLLPSALSNPVNHDAESVSQKGKFVMETYKKSATDLKEKYVDTNTKLLPSALSNPVNNVAESVLQKEKHETQNSNKPLIIIKENYADIASKRIPKEQDLGHHVPAFDRLINAQTMPMPMPFPSEGDKQITEAFFPLARDEPALVHDNVKTSGGGGVGYIGSEFEGHVAKDKSLCDSNSIGINDETSLFFVTEDDYQNQEITDEAVFTAVDDLRVCSPVKESKCDTFFDDFDRHNNAKHTMPMPSEGDKQITEAFFPLARDESALVHDNVKTSGVGYIGSEFEGHVAKEKSLCDSNSTGINDETSLFFVTEDDYQNQEITDEAVFTAVDDLRVCSPVKERTCDTFFDDFDRHNNAKQTMTMPFPSEGDKQITEPFFPLARDESALVHDNVKISGVGYIGSEFEGHVAKENSLCDSNSVGINDETSLFFVTEDEYQNQEITDEAVFTAVDDLRVCYPVKERTCDTFFDDFDRHNNAKQTMPMPFPSEGDKQITEAFFPLARDESALVHDNVKTSGVGYIGSEFEGHVAKEKSLCDSNSIGINDETSLLFFVTEDDFQNQEITDETVFTAVDDLRVCAPVKERRFDTFFDDCHCKIIGTPQSYKVECSSSHGCQVAEPTLNSSSSSLSNDSYHQSGSYTILHETENFVNELTDSVSNVSETSGHADESKIDISDPNMKTIDLSEKSKLNESCVIVDNKLLGSTSCRPRRHRSYKQMIKDAYTKTKRLTKEYEFLGILYGDIDNEPVQHEKHSSKFPSISEITPGNEQSLTEDSSDDWELV